MLNHIPQHESLFNKQVFLRRPRFPGSSASKIKGISFETESVYDRKREEKEEERRRDHAAEIFPTASFSQAKTADRRGIWY